MNAVRGLCENYDLDDDFVLQKKQLSHFHWALVKAVCPWMSVLTTPAVSLLSILCQLQNQWTICMFSQYIILFVKYCPIFNPNWALAL